MNIYLSHSTDYDFRKKLYLPIKTTELPLKHQFIFPHEFNKLPFNSKICIKTSDLILAEISFPATGQGIELGWANVYKTPIVCLYQSDKKFSQSLKIITDNFLAYANTDEMI